MRAKVRSDHTNFRAGFQTFGNSAFIGEIEEKAPDRDVFSKRISAQFQANRFAGWYAVKPNTDALRRYIGQLVRKEAVRSTVRTESAVTLTRP